MKYDCPACKESLKIGRAYDGRWSVRCQKCDLVDIFVYNGSDAEVYMEVLIRYDEGRTSGDEQMVRSVEEIEQLIQRHKPDSMTRDILRTKYDYIAHYDKISAPASKFGRSIGELGLHPGIVDRLGQMGITNLYEFQDRVIEAVRDGADVVIEAPTASGKTEAFTIPIVDCIAKESRRGISAILVYPTKALSRDQLPKISEMATSAGLRVAVFDGDTPVLERERILSQPPEILITNFDVLHLHMWQRKKLASLLSGARYVVVDEAHSYSGIFGSNVYYIIKRLQRLTDKIQCIGSSATLNNAAEFCSALFDRTIMHIRGQGRKTVTEFAMIFPSLRSQRQLMIDLTLKLVSKKHKTIVFNNSHKTAELLAVQARRRRSIRIMVHRSGISPEYLRRTERLFRNGDIDAISCTPTLELGIDIGDVDGIVSSIIPSNRLAQRMGRAARSGQKGYAFLALGDGPISQYYKNHPHDYFEDVEENYIDPHNPFVEEAQLIAMAHDRPIQKSEVPEHRDVVEDLVRRRLLIFDGEYYRPSSGSGDVLKRYNIRGIGDSIDIMHGTTKKGFRALPIALEELHKDAIYFLGGRRYRVTALHYPKDGYAELETIPRGYPYYTKALKKEMPEIIRILEKRRIMGIEVAFCSLRIQRTVWGYANVELGQEVEQGQKIELDEPLQYDLVTKGIVFTAPSPDDAIATSEQPDYTEASGYHASEHVLIEASNMIIGGASQDMGGISLDTTGLIYIYDGAIGGSGASRALYDRMESALARAYSILSECPCRSQAGCPRCTFSYRCGNNNEYLDKTAAIEVLRRINDGQKTDITDPGDIGMTLV